MQSRGLAKTDRNIPAAERPPSSPSKAKTRQRASRTIHGPPAIAMFAVLPPVGYEKGKVKREEQSTSLTRVWVVSRWVARPIVAGSRLPP